MSGRDSRYRGSYRGGYQRSYGSPYDSTRGRRGGYSGSYGGSYGGYDDGRDGYDRHRDGYGREREDYDRYESRHHSRGGYNPRFSARGNHYNARGGHYHQGEFSSRRESWFNKEKTPSSTHSNESTSFNSVAPRTSSVSRDDTPNAKSNSTVESTTPSKTSGQGSPWIKLLGMDETDRVQKTLGIAAKTEIDEIRRTHQANYFKIRDCTQKLDELETDTYILKMQLGSLEAGINGYETYKTARIDVIDKITLLGEGD